jgi:hypothetical protein
MQTDVRLPDRRFAWALVLACIAAPAWAQEPIAVTAPSEPPTAEQIVDELRGALPDAAVSAEDEALLQKALSFDPAQIASGVPAKPLASGASAPSKGLDMARTEHPDGSSTVALKKPLPTEWDSKVGVDLALDSDTRSSDPVLNPMPTTKDNSGSRAAWASVGVAPFATVDARVDAANDTGLLATKFKHALPVGNNFSVSFESRYSVTETYGTPQAASPDVPLMAAPAGTPGAPVPHVFGNDNVAKFAILPSGTTLAAGLSSTSTDPVTHNSLSAEQRVYGPLQITTALNDIGQPSESRSIRARLKLNW